MATVKVRRSKDGVWYCRPYLGTSATGKRIRRYRSFPEAQTEEQAQALAEEWAERERIAASRSQAAPSLADQLERYIIYLADEGYPANTIKTYRVLLRNYIEPHTIGRTPAGDVNPLMVSGLYGELRDHGARDGGRLQAATVVTLHNFLSGAYRWMSKMKIVGSNPMAAVDRPRPDRHEAFALEADEAMALDGFVHSILGDVTHGDAKHALDREVAMAVYLALHTGMRCGEVLALDRRGFRASARQLTVRATIIETRFGAIRQESPKTRSSFRTISISTHDVDVVTDHKSWQDAEYGKLKRHALICGGKRPMRPSKVSSRFSAWARELDLPEGTTFHTLRHTHATQLIQAGESAVTVQERLGHSKVGTTLEIYGHLLRNRDRSAAETWDRLMRGGDQ